MKIKVGIIGFGRMGRFYLQEFRKNDKYEVAYICDIDDTCLNLARQLSPESKAVKDVRELYNDPDVQLVVHCAYASERRDRIEMAVKTGKNIIAEKPISDTVENEAEVVKLTRNYNKVCTVNMYLRNSWYHKVMKDFVDSGEIGDLAIIRVCHMTPGLAPGEGHVSEGPCFHDCGMHYVDIARMYSGSEYKTWHAQGVRMWSYKDPWWIDCHGTFENGIVFDITQGFVYGQLSKDQTHNSYVELIGSKGLVRMRHDFNTAHVELRGINETKIIEHPYGGKNIDVMIERVANSIESGNVDVNLPRMVDSAIASKYAWIFFNDSLTHDLPCIDNNDTLIAIRNRRSIMNNGYGLLPRNHVGAK
jgi:predicted dehydrogenase